MAKVKRGKVVRYNKWGYIFLIPFVVVYVLFQLIPLFRTFYYSFFENYRSGPVDVHQEYIDHVGTGICTADHHISASGCMVLGSQP